MRELAKRFEISDVGLAKACRNADIPVPPRGYWNKQQAGHRVVKADLPLRRPGHSDTVTIGRDRGWYRADRLDLDLAGTCRTVVRRTNRSRSRACRKSHCPDQHKNEARDPSSLD